MTEHPTNPDLTIRYTEMEDGKFLRDWLLEPETMCWFPMCDQAEVEDAVPRWIGFSRYKCSLTALMHGVPCGLATLYLQPYRDLAHQCEMGIVVGKDFRNLGIGSFLLTQLMKLAKEGFRIELLHLTVYAKNPAIRLYKKFGFREFGRQSHWIKEKSGAYVARVFMERLLE